MYLMSPNVTLECIIDIMAHVDDASLSDTTAPLHLGSTMNVRTANLSTENLDPTQIIDMVILKYHASSCPMMDMFYVGYGNVHVGRSPTLSRMKCLLSLKVGRL